MGQRASSLIDTLDSRVRPRPREETKLPWPSARPLPACPLLSYPTSRDFYQLFPAFTDVIFRVPQRGSAIKVGGRSISRRCRCTLAREHPYPVDAWRTRNIDATFAVFLSIADRSFIYRPDIYLSMLKLLGIRYRDFKLDLLTIFEINVWNCGTFGKLKL